MAVSYKKLFHLLIEKDMTNAQLMEQAGFSANIITRLKRNEYVSMESLENIGIGFKEFFIYFIIAIPYLILVAVFVLLILGIVLFCVKKGTSKHKKAEYPVMQMGAMQAPVGVNGVVQNTKNEEKINE